MTDRAFLIHFARVHIAEAGRRRHHPANKDFYWQLLAWAARCRREVARFEYEPAQTELFQ